MLVSVLTPTYKSIPFFKETLDSLFKQTYQNFELIICNDSSDEDELRKFLDDNYKSFSSKIIFEQNSENLGYSKNIKKCFEKSKGQIIYLLAQDDIIIRQNHLQEIVDIYQKNDNIGFTSRPYFWFDDDIDNILRRTPKSNIQVISNKDSTKLIDIVISSIGQLSGLSFKRIEGIKYKFSPHIFTAHVYPFMQNFLVKDCYFFDYDTIAVRMSSSQTTFLSSIYSPAPTLTWMVFIEEIFSNNDHLKNIFRESFGKNYIGLLQIKNYGHYKDLILDIFYLVKYRPRNLINPKFWALSLTALIVPRKLLKLMVSFYKNKINKKIIKQSLSIS